MLLSSFFENAFVSLLTHVRSVRRQHPSPFGVQIFVGVVATRVTTGGWSFLVGRIITVVPNARGNRDD